MRRLSGQKKRRMTSAPNALQLALNVA
jgi:hypothetical protein